MTESRKKHKDHNHNHKHKNESDWSHMSHRVQRLEKLISIVIVVLALISLKLLSLSSGQPYSHTSANSIFSVNPESRTAAGIYTDEDINTKETAGMQVGKSPYTERDGKKTENTISEDILSRDPSKSSSYVSSDHSLDMKPVMSSSLNLPKSIQFRNEDVSAYEYSNMHFPLSPHVEAIYEDTDNGLMMIESNSPLSRTSDSAHDNSFHIIESSNAESLQPYRSEFDVFKTSSNMIEKMGRKGSLSRQRQHRKLQTKETNITCEGTSSLFQLELYLSDNAFENSWDLVNRKNETIVARQIFSEADNSTDIYFPICLVPGPYIFTLYDEGGDGFECDDRQGCYNIFVNKDIIVEGHAFVGKKLVHKFDTSSPCVMDNNVVLTLDKNVTKDMWAIFDTQSVEQVKFELSLAQGEKNDSYRACLPVGSYSLSIVPLKGGELICDDIEECFTMEINGVVTNPRKSNRMPLSRIFFSISKDGVGYGQICPMTPILSPTTFFKDIPFDDEIAKKLDLIYSVSSFDDVHDHSAPQYKAACWILYDDVESDLTFSKKLIERYILYSLLYLANQPAETVPKDICNYDENRVECDDEGYIKSINFEGLNIHGRLLSEISNLFRLERIILANNNLVGTIPSSIGQLWFLTDLNLTHNELTGTIFSEIGNINSLVHLSLGDNHLSGTFPSEIGSCLELENLLLGSNQISGSIPSQIYDLTKMSRINLGNNRLTGTISSSINNFKNVSLMRLEKNRLAGTIPDELFELPLTFLSLGINQFSGSLPQGIVTFKGIQRLLLNNNSFIGSLPDFFGNMTELEIADFSNNHFTGTIPASLRELENLNILTTKNNDFRDSLDIDCDKYAVLKVDSSIWFKDEPKVDCKCCDFEDCHIWNLADKNVEISCPINNVKSFKYFETFEGVDIIANFTYHSGQFITQEEAQLCLSPTGCYNFRYMNENLIFESETMAFSSESKKLEMNGECEVVSICGVHLDSSNPKRKLLNHLTQIINIDITNINVSDTYYKSLCWILTEDKMSDSYEICDGTLMQRFVIGTFYLSTGFKTDLNELNNNETCGWKGVTCDTSNGKFVEGLNMASFNLTGTIMNEIGLLTRLKTIDLSSNELTGSLDPIMFLSLPYLEVFAVGTNHLEGNIPKELFLLPQIRRINLSSNTLGGRLPDNTSYSDSLEYINVGRNILRGVLPLVLLKCERLQYLDVSENGLSGDVPIEIGFLTNLEELRLNQNRFLGTIPGMMFDARSIGVLMMHSNELTGSIPTEVGKLLRARNITMNHNSLKSSIPTEFSNIKNLSMLHLHQNKLTGTAPNLGIQKSKAKKNFTFITDCNALTSVECDNCTMCCDDDGNCKHYDSASKRLYVNAVTLFFAVPMGIFMFVLVSYYIRHYVHLPILEYKPRDPLSIYNEESVYSYIFSQSRVAWFVHIFTYAVQLSLFFSFLWASDQKNTDNLMASNFKCLPESVSCIDQEVLGIVGWLLFFALTLLYLGTDIVNALLQIRKSVADPFNPRLLINGVLLLGLSILSLSASYYFNVATAGSNIDLIVNAVVLLFINDLDEQTMTLSAKMFPSWNDDRVAEVKDFLTKRQATIDLKESFHKSIILRENALREMSPHDLDLEIDQGEGKSEGKSEGKGEGWNEEESHENIPNKFNAESIYVGNSNTIWE